jgi:hypothetical protein
MVLRARRLSAVLVAAFALVLLISSASFAGSTTTQPGKTVLVYFVINDKNIAYAIYREQLGGGTNELTLQRYVLRGDFAKFFVINRGKKPHGFAFLGKKFAPLGPGHKTQFSRALLTRGKFPYRSTTDSGKAFRGVFPVY